MTSIKRALQAAAGAAAGEALYVEDVFSTYLYTGNGSTQTITNGIDLDGEGGLVWIKSRTGAYNNYLATTPNGFGWLYSNTTDSILGSGGSTFSFNSDGWTTTATGVGVNGSGQNYASWTFRKAPKFFDVVTYTGDGTTSNAIAHNLGATPACIIIKPLDTALFNDWRVWHKDLSTQQYQLKLNTADAEQLVGNFISQNDTTFTVGYPAANQSGINYVAYLFASDAGGFGDDDESIIKCGSFVPSTTWQSVIDIGFEPQWILYKKSTGSGNWFILDNMRGINSGSADPVLYANTSDAEITYIDSFNLHANGFEQTFSSVDTNTYIYIAIRRPMKTPESGTEVFAPVEQSGGSFIDTGFVADLLISKETTRAQPPWWVDRLRGAGYKFLRSDTSGTEDSYATNYFPMDYNDGVEDNWNSSSYENIYWAFKRATGFFDVVAYTGAGGTGTINHNLGVVPEMIIVKARQATTADEWYVYHAGTWGDDGSDIFRIVTQGAQYTNGYFASTAPTSTYFKVGSSLHASGIGFVSYLFASLDGVSKVGTFTPSASVDTDVDCGFSSGARFVLIKSSVSGDWYIWDSSRGIVAGNDPYLLLNSTAAEVTIRDWIDPLSSGFTITSAYANSTGSANKHIFLAIA